ncbi:DUF3656 domain-containing protein, partial [Klebsiella pneumoniae]|nr:DUF3656 domain-containing protein [Klebsiella pneumoniae]
GMGLYRNNDQEFERILNGETSERKLPINMAFGLTNDGFSLKVSSEENHVSLEENIEFAHQVAQKPQHDNILKQLSKLGNTIFEAEEIVIN